MAHAGWREKFELNQKVQVSIDTAGRRHENQGYPERPASGITLQARRVRLNWGICDHYVPEVTWPRKERPL